MVDNVGATAIAGTKPYCGLSIPPSSRLAALLSTLAHDFGGARQHINIVVRAEVADQFLDAVVGVDPGTRSASRNSQAAAA